MNISSLINVITTAMDKVRVTLPKIPGLLLLCTACRRSGFSTILTSAKIYSEMDYVEEEFDDIVKEFVFNVVNRIKMNIQDDGVCFIAIPPNAIQLQLNGGNAGGPVVLVGSNKNYVFTWGIIR